jgi:Zn-dependent protease with chaperone function
MSVPEVTKTKTMFEIEREARWRVWALFALLLFMVYLCIWVVVMAAEGVVEALSQPAGVDRHFLTFSLSPRGVGLILVFSAAVAVFYWFVSRIGARDHLTRAMHAQPLDPDDRFHQRLADIVEEMRIATGGPAIRCLTVSTVGMNAFAFSDLHGSACIGVTEGALSRLSRQQLEAVVAHEFGHVLSGDYITATSACLLFGVYTSLGDALDDALSAGSGGSALVLLGAVGLRGLLGLLQLGSAVTNAAISRQRESLADLAAARYTRDPLSLAQALQMML